MAPFLLLLKSLGEGERWITVRPHGPGTEGQPVLIKPSGDGSYHVIGGAGGSLNNLKLTGVKEEGAYTQELAARAKSRKEELKRRAASDREHGLSESKAAIKEGIKAQVGDQAYKFIRQVAEAAGWGEDKLRFAAEEHQNLSEGARKKAEEQHANKLLKAAMDVVELQRKRLVLDGEARQEAGLGEVPLTTSKPEDLSVQDLDPINPETKGLGFAPAYQKRAVAQGATAEEIKSEAEAAKPTDAKQAEARDKRKVTTEAIAKELESVRQMPLPLDKAQMLDAKQAVELMKAAKQFAEVRKQAREKLKKVAAETAIPEPKAYIIETGGQVDPKDLAAGLDSDLRTLRTRGFLNEIGRIAPGENIGRHVAVGAYNAINSLALAAGGASLLDRSVVDVLGVGGAAQVLVRRLRSDLTGEDMDQIGKAMGTFHIDKYMALSDESLRAARDWHEMANEIEIGEAANGADLAVAQELNAKRREFISNANRVLGTSLGEMEANAAIVAALGQPTKAWVQVSLGKTSLSAAIQQVRALGLEKADYVVAEAGGNTVLTIQASGMDKLAAPVSKANLVATRESLDIMAGKQDEADWLPAGVANRPDLAMNIKPGTAASLAQPFKVEGGNIGQAVSDYIGGRAADGDSPAEIMKGLLSEDTMQVAGDREAFISSINAVAPLYGSDGKMIRVETYAQKFNELADDYVERRFGADRTPLHRQQFAVDGKSVDALHRALAAHPEGVAAFKPVGELTAQDQGALRKVFTERYGRLDPKAESLRQKVTDLDKQEPPKEAEGLFGVGANPDWARWKTERDEAATAANAATLDWPKYVSTMGSPEAAYQAMSDVVRGDVIHAFGQIYNKLQPKAPLKMGHQVIANDLRHLDALDPKARETRLARQRDLIDSLRNRVAGRYASGSVAEKQDAARAADLAASQAQMGLFGQTDEPDKPEAPLELGERYSIGHEAERQIAGMMSVVGPNFRAGQPLKLWKPTMSGKYVGRQRAVKLIEHNKRTMLGLGVGSGKTSIMLSAFTDLKAKGQAHRGLFMVPSVVQGQFHGEALTLLEPGKYSWHADPSADRAARIAKYKDPKNDFSVVTHQGFRDDLLHLAAGSEGTSPEEVATKLDAMQPNERKSYIKGVLDKEGIHFDYLAVDEGHNLLNRAGKKNSHMANVVDGVSANTPYYVNSTADPVKNDASEAYDVMSKLRPDEYSDRDAFMRRYGVDTDASREGLRREMARSFYTGQIDPGVKANRQTVNVDVGPESGKIGAVDQAAASARLARLQGRVDVAAMKVLSPASFVSAPEGMHEDIARALQGNLGLVHNAALQHAVNDGAKTAALSKLAGERKGKPGVVFIHSLERVKQAAERLGAEGHRVGTLTGADSSAEKDRKKRDFAAGKFDILIASDAGAVGANLQTGKWLVQYDTPQTAMLHAQRNGRIHRIGQTEDVELIDLVANHPSEARARKRLETKYGLREVMTSPLDGLDETGVASYLSQARAGTLQKPQAAAPTEADREAEAAPPDAQQSMF